MFQVSTFAFFFLPMTVITVMYILIGLRLRKTEIGSTSGVLSASAKNTATRARKAVLKMLGKSLSLSIVIYDERTKC